MMSKIVLVATAAAGYVLGARAGRERYDQIHEQASRLWGNPKVQEKASQAESFVKDKVPGADRVPSMTGSSSGTSDSPSHKGDSSKTPSPGPAGGAGADLLADDELVYSTGPDGMAGSPPAGQGSAS